MTLKDNNTKISLPPDMSLEVLSLVESPATHRAMQRSVLGVGRHVGPVVPPGDEHPTHLALGPKAGAFAGGGWFWREAA